MALVTIFQTLAANNDFPTAYLDNKYFKGKLYLMFTFLFDYIKLRKKKSENKTLKKKTIQVINLISPK